MTRDTQFASEWKTHPRWQGIQRLYTPHDVLALRGQEVASGALAKQRAEKLWRLLETQPFVAALGASSPSHAIEQVQAGLQAIYVSGWQIAADASGLGVYPDLGQYPSDRGPQVVRVLNAALQRGSQIHHGLDWHVPLVLDLEAGFGGLKNAYTVTEWAIDAGAAAIHLEDQADKKCGHLGGKCLEATSVHIEKLQAARLAADVADVPLIIIGRTDAGQAKFLRTTGVPNPADQGAVLGTTDAGKALTFHEAKQQRCVTAWTDRGIIGRWTPTMSASASGTKLYTLRGSLALAIERALAYAPHSDLLWMETATPDLKEARQFAEAIHAKYPRKKLAYNLSPSFNWSQVPAATRKQFLSELGTMGYQFQFITLAGFHTQNLSMFELTQAFLRDQMEGYYACVQARELIAQRTGYTAVKHQRQVGTGIYDVVETALGMTGTAALTGSTEEAQFTTRSRRQRRRT